MILSIQTFAEQVINSASETPSVYLGILFALFELFVRLRPTKRNLSILAKLGLLIQVVLPNHSTEKAISDAGKVIRKKFPY